MYKDIDNTEYDFVIFGTSLQESILSAYLSKNGKKVLHLDISKYYGGDCKNFNLKDMTSFIKEITEDTVKDSFMKGMKVVDFCDVENGRAYNFDLNPKFIYSKSKATEELTNSKASNYLEFVSMKKIFVFFAKFLSVPCTKSEIFISDDLELVEKQKLLSFIYAVMKVMNKELDVNTTVDIKKDYDIEHAILEDITANLSVNADEFLKIRYSNRMQVLIKLVLANIDPNSDECTLITVEHLIGRIHKFLLSLQVYDDSPFLYPQYGSSEFAQALCRLSAVNQGTFIVHDNLSTHIEYNKGKFANQSEKTFAIRVNDSTNKESFVILAEKVIINEAFFNTGSMVTFEKEVAVNECNLQCESTMHRFIAFYIIEGEYQKRSITEGPVMYKVQKNDPIYKNSFGLTAFEFLTNSNSTPKDRSMLQIIIHSKEKENFITQADGVCETFLINHLKELNHAIETEENKFKLSATFKFHQSINTSTDKNKSDHINTSQSSNKGNIIITTNNYNDMDLDCYYEQAEQIVKREGWTQFEVDQVAKEDPMLNEEVSPDSLIDELFDSITI